MIEIFDAIPSKMRYTRFEFEVATTLARELFKIYNNLIFDDELEDVPVIFKNYLENGRERCAGLTFPQEKGPNAERIELSMSMIRSGYRIKKVVLHEMCHVYRFSEENPNDPHGKVWKSNSQKAVKKLKKGK